MKKAAILTALSVAVLLTGCGQSQKATGNSSSSNSSSSQTVKQKKNAFLDHKSATIPEENLSAKQTASIITTYAAKKYNGDWLKTLRQAYNGHLLYVQLYDANDYQIANRGQGVVYQIGAQSQTGTVYTIDSQKQVHLYTQAQNGKAGHEIGHATVKQMAKYLNRHGGADVAEKLTGYAEINDRRLNNSSSSNGSVSVSSSFVNDSAVSNSSSSASTNISAANNATSSSATVDSNAAKMQTMGREGLYDIPNEMRGVWYTEDSSGNGYVVEIGANTMSFDGQTVILYKENADWRDQHTLNPDSTLLRVTSSWGAAEEQNLNGNQWLNIKGWLQGAGAGTSFTTKTENVNGKPQVVLVEASGARPWTDNVWYRSQSTAHQVQNQRYGDLSYRE